MNRLIQDGLAAFNVEQNKYTLPDGSGLPTLPFSAGGVAKYLREHHTNVNQTTTTASASSVSLVFDSNMALGGNLIGITADEYNDYVSQPVTRSGKDTSKRHDPIVRPAKDKGKEKEKDKSVHFDPKPPTAPSPSVPQVPLQPVPVRPTPSTSKVPIVPAPPDIPRPTNPLNTRDGWKDAKGQKNPAHEDVTMKDATSKTKDQGKYYLTSDLQESISLERVEKHILDQVVSLPLRDILGISSGLQRRLQEATKTRREYYTSAGEYDLVTEEAEKYLAQSNTATYATTTKRLYCPEQDEFFTFLVRFTNAVSLNQTRLLAMTTGVFKGKLYGQTIRFMVDTGSELNLIPDRLLSIPGLALDYEGQKWSLKGINGPSVGLRGVCLGAEITIGAHRFDHHLFVSGENMTSQDCILGQPWAHWFAARIDFDRSGEMAMEIWKNGDRSEPPTLRLQLTIPDDPKNVTTFDHRTHRRETASNNTLQAAQVEDVTDSECEEDDFEKDFHITSMPPTTFGRSLQALLDSFDYLLQQAYYATDENTKPILSPWTARAFNSLDREPQRIYSSNGRKYKPVARKYKPIPLPNIEPLPVLPPPRNNINPTELLTTERFNLLMNTIPAGFLSEQELDLVAFVVDRRQRAFAFNYREKGIFKREYYPDYEIPTIEHTPWQRPPMRVPKALEAIVRREIQDQEAAGRFEPTTSSYRSAIFPVAKKDPMRVPYRKERPTQCRNSNATSTMHLGLNSQTPRQHLWTILESKDQLQTTTMNLLLRTMRYAGITGSGLKTVLATPRLRIVGTVVSLEGWHLDSGIITKVLNWPIPRNLTGVRGFLGTAGVVANGSPSFQSSQSLSPLLFEVQLTISHSQMRPTTLWNTLNNL
ncbi:hypothetical protein BDQ17DRAFT_1330165 [Cyathus striatus]|nr:hypothetical protein BDQ17DRAFT_1330165 [Cyathus striatus]